MKFKILSILLFLLSIGSELTAQQLKVGDKAPVFELPNQRGQKYSIADSIGKRVLVIYFFPNSEGEACIRQSKSFKDSYAEFQQAGGLVLGINEAGPSKLRILSNMLNLPFELLSDKDNKTRELYHVPSGILAGPGRYTFVIDLEGNIAFVCNSFNDGDEHVRTAVESVKKLSAQTKSPSQNGTVRF